MKNQNLSNDIEEIENYIRRLSVRERKILLKGLKRKVLLQEAQELSKSVNKAMKISMDEILEEINGVRAKNAA